MMTNMVPKILNISSSSRHNREYDDDYRSGSNKKYNGDHDQYYDKYKYDEK